MPDIWTHGPHLQIVDGPDEVHLRGIARAEIRDVETRRRVADVNSYCSCFVLLILSPFKQGGGQAMDKAFDRQSWAVVAFGWAMAPLATLR